LVHFVWLMGSDNLENFHRWKRWQDIAARIPVAVVVRPGSALAPLKSNSARRLQRYRVASPRNFVLRRPPALIVLDGPRNPLSATAIRAERGQEALVGAPPAC
jgi:nicotinate-nucleotide adenylyltransferase